MLERGVCGGTAFFCAGADPPDKKLPVGPWTSEKCTQVQRCMNLSELN